MAMSTIDPIQTQEGLQRYLSSQKPYSGIDAFTIHHCYRPNQAQYRGRSTVMGVKSFHMQSRALQLMQQEHGAGLEIRALAETIIAEMGFDPRQHDLVGELQYDDSYDGERGMSDIAAHLYATPEERVKWYTARPLSTKNGAHAYVEKKWADVPAHARRLCGNNRQWFNYRSFGLEMIADFTSEPYKTMPQVLKNGLVAVATVLDFYDLPTKNVIVHSDVAYKSCPNIPREFLMQEIDKIRKGEVDVSEYAKADVEWAKKNGIMSGYNAQEFGGQDPIKRQDVAIVSHRVVNYMMERYEELEARVARLEAK
jgi:hypothetical protein